ncbi:MAG TPA: hypothetical protein VHA56_16170 [Mucilaginibacter sp.]|nr:hypothetical protein [Mucilaginibacter sp.]
MAKKKENKGAAQGAAPSPEEKETKKPQGAAQPETLEEALEQIKKLQADNGDLAGQVNEAKGVITDLKAQLKSAREKAASDSKVPTIKIDGVTYQVNHGAHGIGNAAALAKNEEACRKILARKGQQALTKI